MPSLKKLLALLLYTAPVDRYLIGLICFRIGSSCSKVKRYSCLYFCRVNVPSICRLFEEQTMLLTK